MFRKIIFYLLFLLMALDIIRGDYAIWYLFGLWFWLVSILIHFEKFRFLRFLLADIALKEVYDRKKAFSSGAIAFIIGLIVWKFF
ncbi:hypothetical protein [Falsibacillus pallidus]|uniref:hypothetical protein n=1 Tax=Falsibacillus pallidus TaxID=493781 RepID=UPI003D95D83A